MAHRRALGKRRACDQAAPCTSVPPARGLTAATITPKTRAPGGFQVRRAFRDPRQGLALTRFCLSVPALPGQRRARSSATAMTIEDANDQAHGIQVQDRPPDGREHLGTTEEPGEPA